MTDDPDDTAELPAWQEPEAPAARGGVLARSSWTSRPCRIRATSGSNNEDHFIAARFDRSMRTLLTNLPEGRSPATLRRDRLRHARGRRRGRRGGGRDRQPHRGPRPHGPRDRDTRLDHAPGRAARPRGPPAHGASLPAGPRGPRRASEGRPEPARHGDDDDGRLQPRAGAPDGARRRLARVRLPARAAASSA